MVSSDYIDQDEESYITLAFICKIFFCIAIHVHARENSYYHIYCATCRYNTPHCDNTIRAHAWCGLVGLYFYMHGLVFKLETTLSGNLQIF